MVDGAIASQPMLPPGFRFHPTDEELVVHYLKKKATATPLPVPIIAEIELYKFDPWDLPEKANFGEQEWYFFSPRERKYPNGARPNRAAASGYWKATGTDKPIFASATAANGSNKLDDWVLCRIYKKGEQPMSKHPTEESCTRCNVEEAAQAEESKSTLPKLGSFTSVLGDANTFFDNILSHDLPHSFEPSSTITNSFDPSSTITPSYDFSAPCTLNNQIFINPSLTNQSFNKSEDPRFTNNTKLTSPPFLSPSSSSLPKPPSFDSTSSFPSAPFDLALFDSGFFPKRSSLFSLPSLTQQSPTPSPQPKLQANDPFCGYKWPYLPRID